MIALVVWKNEKIFSKVKLFFKKCKWLIALELIIVIALATFNILDSSVIIKEKNPHTNEILKQDTLKEGQIYTYYTMYYEKNEEEKGFSNMMQNLKVKEKPNEIKIEEAGITKVKVLVNDVEKEYEYGCGFSYYSMTSCSCGTPIIFEKTLTGVIKIIILAIMIINLFMLVFIKNKNTDN